MKCGKAEDAGGLSPVKDDNAAARHFIRRTLMIVNRGDYILPGAVRVKTGMSVFSARFTYYVDYATACVLI